MYVTEKMHTAASLQRKLWQEKENFLQFAVYGIGEVPLTVRLADAQLSFLSLSKELQDLLNSMTKGEQAVFDNIDKLLLTGTLADSHAINYAQATITLDCLTDGKGLK